LHGQYKTDPKAVKKQVAQQFESLFMQMVMRSMRDANKSFSSDLVSSNDMDFYQEMFDKQLSLSMSSRGLGIAKMIEDNIDAQNAHIQPIAPEDLKQPDIHYQLKAEASLPVDETALAAPTTPADKSPALSHFDNPKAFVQAMWSSAKKAASHLGVSPSVLIAQAALETDWGKKMLNHNLFNIKADSQWKKASTQVASLENKNGVLVKEKSNFRAYGSVDESLDDYAHFVKTNQRYSQALSQANNPEQYLQGLQAAGYATDTQYAKKIMEIHESPHFKNLLLGLK
jgi:flagellar protein FlgJ